MMSKNMRYFSLACVSVLLTLGFFGCKGENGAPSSSSATQQVCGFTWNEGNQAAVAFLGYYRSADDFRQSAAYGSLLASYPLLSSCAEVWDEWAEFDELYLVVPRDSSVTIHAIDALGGANVDVPDSLQGSPFLMVSDAGRVELTLRDSLGQTTSFHLLMANGTLSLPSNGVLLDISPRMPSPLNGLDHCANAAGWAAVDIRNGCPIISIDYDKLINSEGLSGDDFLARADSIHVKYLNGICVGVHLMADDMGHPVLCALNNDSTVRLFNVWKVVNGEAETLSDPLLGISGIVDFENNADSTIAYAKDAEGNLLPVTTYHALTSKGLMTHAEDSVARADEMLYSLTLGSNWNISFNGRNEQQSETFSGSFRLAESSEPDSLPRWQVIEYLFRTCSGYGVEQADSAGGNKAGTFRLEEVEDSLSGRTHYLMTPLTGFDMRHELGKPLEMR